MNEDFEKTEIALRFERVFTDVILELIEKRNLTISSFAHKAFPIEYRSDPVRRFRAMITPGKLGKPQRVSLADAYLITKALGIELPYLILTAC
jgi:hypothetical protein